MMTLPGWVFWLMVAGDIVALAVIVGAVAAVIQTGKNWQ